jgi:hypothetical protein
MLEKELDLYVVGEVGNESQVEDLICLQQPDVPDASQAFFCT